MKKVAIPLAAIVLLGCGSKSSFDITVPDSLDPKAKQVLQETWPKVKQACVGLDRHADALKFDGVEDNYYIDVVFRVPEASSVPDGFMAAGHRCYLGISRDGKMLTITKEGCKAICLDRKIQKDEPAGIGDLKFAL